MHENEASELVIGCCLKIHKQLGPGLLESVYKEALGYELVQSNLKYFRQKSIPISDATVRLDVGFRADVVVEEKVLLELKSAERILPVHKKQILTYLRVSGLKLGLLINFNVPLLKDGITRIVNGLDCN